MTRLLILATVALAACGGGVTASNDAANACHAAFVAAAGVDSMADSVSDLYPAMRACGTVAEWTEAYNAVDGAGFDGAAEQVLANACLAVEVADELLCAEVP